VNFIFEEIRLRPPIQFLQPFSHFMSARFTHIAMLTVRMVDSQKGQQVASQLHDRPRGIRYVFSTWKTTLAEWMYYATRCVCNFKRVCASMRGVPKEENCEV
jgi:hypothetical protein